ncbi:MULTISPECIES: hypothetical protein [unclassified Yoonia]|uniref:hypothetical protein n=1 Tax=unclassified Yoonia TaxID=2629118 RepID=UPI002AFFB667|nr:MULTISPECIES: hypothetical protein [unclassified Yoonia]
MQLRAAAIVLCIVSGPAKAEIVDYAATPSSELIAEINYLNQMVVQGSLSHERRNDMMTGMATLSVCDGMDYDEANMRFAPLITAFDGLAGNSVPVEIPMANWNNASRAGCDAASAEAVSRLEVTLRDIRRQLMVGKALLDRQIALDDRLLEDTAVSREINLSIEEISQRSVSIPTGSRNP